MRRGLLVAAVAMTLVAPAQAKMPTFTVEVIPETPIAGEPFVIEVTLDSRIPVWMLNSLVEVRRPNDPETRRPVFLRHVAGATYQEEITIDEPGEWEVFAFPDRTGWPDQDLAPWYPERTPFTVRSPSSARPWIATAVALGLLLVGVGVKSSPARRR